MGHVLDSDALAERYRSRSVRQHTRELLLARLAGSDQEDDLTLPANCRGLGRIRHFSRHSQDGFWGSNPLPIEPAQRALGVPSTEGITAQAFQNAACNWRCWYCFVPFNLLAADESRSAWVTADDLVSMYSALPNRPSMIDLTGGQPDLVPEWISWMIDAVEARGLRDDVYLWSDDNLSNDYFWRFLSDKQMERIATWKNYGRVCCFKGYDPQSFAFNTAADGSLFERQFELFGRLLTLGLDLYAYVTLTTMTLVGLRDAMARFFDRLQEVHPNLPLRTVPLRIQVFSPVRHRMSLVHEEALDHQERVVETFRDELQARFSSSLRSQSICDIPLGTGVQKRTWP
jgi:uncharacterized Fe-S cluster-containing radical SAM superfamily protein